MGRDLYPRHDALGDHDGLGGCVDRPVSGAPSILLGDGRAGGRLSGDGRCAELDRADLCHLCAASDRAGDDVSAWGRGHGALVRSRTGQGAVAIVYGLCSGSGDFACRLRRPFRKLSLAQPLGAGRRFGADHHAGDAAAAAARAYAPIHGTKHAIGGDGRAALDADANDPPRVVLVDDPAGDRSSGLGDGAVLSAGPSDRGEGLDAGQLCRADAALYGDIRSLDLCVGLGN